MAKSQRAAAPVVALLAVMVCLPSNVRAQNEPVTVTEDAAAFTLANGIVTASVSKKTGDLTSLRYKGMEMLDQAPAVPVPPRPAPSQPAVVRRGGTSGHPGGYWSHDATSPQSVAAITIDPRSNGGRRAEVSVKGISGGRPMGSGPGGTFISDIEIRYTMERGASGVYTYSIFTHQPGYPGSSLGEARFCVKLSDVFDWMAISPRWSKLYPKEPHEDKYDFTQDQFENPAYGWCSTAKKIGFWLVNPTVEYLSGGPTKVEFLGHRDTTQVAAPCILNYWRSSHYGGAYVEVSEGERWNKVIGPFFLYVDAAENPRSGREDSLAQYKKEAAKWPYDWVSGIDYPHRPERATVKGELVLHDSLAPAGVKMGKLMVGLTYPAYTVTVTGRGGTTIQRQIDWQTDAKHYEFWVRADDHGRFTIPNVRPGEYTLHAFADGVLGEYAKTGITLKPGQTVDFGALAWTPVRRGAQLWDIGIPNRNASEFLKGDDYFHDGMPLLYPKLFPNDVKYVAGKSDFRKDWYFEQVPHSEDPNAKAGLYGGGGGNGRATPYSITFDLTKAPSGKTVLRLAICGGSAPYVDVLVNQHTAGRVQLAGDSTIARNGITGIWYERELPFDASLMKQGTNVMQLVVPAGPVTSGVLYDYLRLELDRSAQAPQEK
ncbi:MAG TPA: polysaccharide lyase family protein [Bryobacteraceae bacterium]|nr:polysaccharide lyase family protein [Bryobacteraceae bacterium]